MTSSLVGCGETVKIAACNKMIEISNQLSPEPEPGAENVFTPQDALQQAERAFRKAKQLEAIALQDPRLQEYKARFVQLYQQEGEALKQAAEAALEAQGIPKADPQFLEESRKVANLYLQATEVYQRQLSALQEFKTYCESQ
ncbi:MAG: hypothetical protein WBD58_06820 [Geitlerinemataceae cyanobacterium]